MNSLHKKILSDKKTIFLSVVSSLMMCGVVVFVIFNNLSQSQDRANESIKGVKTEENQQQITEEVKEQEAQEIKSKEEEQVPIIESNQTPPVAVNTQQPNPQIEQPPSEKKFKNFSGQEFVNLSNAFAYSGVEQVTTPPPITYNQEVDSYIQKMAEKRGYRLRPISSHSSLNATMQQAIQALQDKAKQEAGLNFVIVSGFRSVEDQRSIFVAQMNANGVDQSLITSGSQDIVLDSILRTRSIPGYSKHHTGYTVDFGCNSYDLLGFKDTKCYEWISKDNYFNAKRFGLIPSYPSGAINQGPDPEQWEYVWVGLDVLQ